MLIKCERKVKGKKYTLKEQRQNEHVELTKIDEKEMRSSLTNEGKRTIKKSELLFFTQ